MKGVDPRTALIFAEYRRTVDLRRMAVRGLATARATSRPTGPHVEELERLDSHLEGLVVAMAPPPPPTVGSDFKPSRWFKANTCVPQDRLVAAASRDASKHVERKRIEGEYLYSVADATRRWPEDMARKPRP